MKKGIATLIKLRQRALDELRRTMASFENQKRQLQEASQKLGLELKLEIEKASQQPQMSHFFGGFAKRIKTRQEQIAGEILALERKMEALSLKITEAFSELKKFEIAQANAKKREKAAADRRETIALDEVAGVQHQRKKNKQDA